MKNVWLTKTTIVNVLYAFLAILASPDVANLIPEKAMKYVIAGQAIINIILRRLTYAPARFTNTDATRIDLTKGGAVILLAVLLGSSGCALTAKQPTAVQQASARKQTADVVDRLTTATGLATGVTESLVTSSLSPALKIEIGCDVLKAVGRDNPTPTITQQCGPLPTRNQSPLQRAVDTAQQLTTCASRQNTIAVAFQVTRPLWEKLEASTDKKLQLAGAAIRLVMVPIPETCGGYLEALN